LFLCVVILHWVTAYGINAGGQPTGTAAGPGYPEEALLEGWGSGGHSKNRNEALVGNGSFKTPFPFDSLPKRGGGPIRGHGRSFNSPRAGRSRPSSYEVGLLTTTIQHIPDIERAYPIPENRIAVCQNQEIGYEDLPPRSEPSSSLEQHKLDEESLSAKM